jgi:hypothetical protein
MIQISHVWLCGLRDMRRAIQMIAPHASAMTSGITAEVAKVCDALTPLDPFLDAGSCKRVRRMEKEYNGNELCGG